MPDSTIEPYLHHVQVTLGDVVLAETRQGLLHRHGYAPDIYVPLADVNLSLFQTNAENRNRIDAIGTDPNVYDVAWVGDENGTLKDHIAFVFDKVTLTIDGTVVRGHVRDPYKVITVRPVSGRLRMSFAGHWAVDSTQALELRETGLPARYYVPARDIDQSVLMDSGRQTVCTYKGEATYHHLRHGAACVENAVWTYAEPWTDFAADIGMIAGFRGLYASAFDRIRLDGQNIAPSAQDAAADKAMIAKPTIDRVLREKAAAN